MCDETVTDGKKCAIAWKLLTLLAADSFHRIEHDNVFIRDDLGKVSMEKGRGCAFNTYALQKC